MTMEVEVDQPEAAVAEPINKDQIINNLTNNESVFFKSQQRGENDLTQQEKAKIAVEIYDKSKLNFLIRFGKHLQRNELEFFQQFAENHEECEEIDVVVKNLLETCKKNAHINVKNRRYEALQEMIREDSYFSEIEMMKRNPLLYEQLVGQYLTQEEKEERDRSHINEEATLVKVLMEGIERDNAQVKRKQQEDCEDEMSQDEEENEDGDMDSDDSSDVKATRSQWGEFADEQKSPKKIKKKAKTRHITVQEQKLLKEEFLSSMYQDFLDGKDEDFNYDTVDNNEKYDNTETNENDEEDKYFDSEEPETVQQPGQEESEDELDIFMSAIDQNPVVSQLSKDIQKL